MSGTTRFVPVTKWAMATGRGIAAGAGIPYSSVFTAIVIGPGLLAQIGTES